MSEDHLEILAEVSRKKEELRIGHAPPFLWALQSRTADDEWTYPTGWPKHYESGPAPMANIRESVRNRLSDTGQLQYICDAFGFDLSGKYVPVIRRLLPNAEPAFWYYSTGGQGGLGGATQRIEYWVQLISGGTWRCMWRTYFPSFVSGRTGKEATSLVGEIRSIDEAMTACRKHYLANLPSYPQAGEARAELEEFPGSRSEFAEAFAKVRRRVQRLRFFDESFRVRQALEAKSRLAAKNQERIRYAEAEIEQRQREILKLERQRERLGPHSEVENFAKLIQTYGDDIPPGYLIHATHFEPPPVGPLTLGLLRAWHKNGPLPTNLPVGRASEWQWGGDLSFLNWIGRDRHKEIMSHLLSVDDECGREIYEHLKSIGREAAGRTSSGTGMAAALLAYSLKIKAQFYRAC